MQEAYNELNEKLAELSDLGAAGALMSWDQQVNMPPGGAEARGRQLATLGKLAHEKLIDSRIGESKFRHQAIIPIKENSRTGRARYHRVPC